MDFIVPDEADGQRADRFVATCIPGTGRTLLTKYFASGNIRINGAKAAKGQRVKTGDRIVVDVAQTDDRDNDDSVYEGNPELQIVYIDDWLIAIDKPAGIASGPIGPADHGPNALHLLGKTHPEVLQVNNEPEEASPEHEGLLLHRLDNDTSGLLLFARTPEAYRLLLPRIRHTTADARHGKYYLAVSNSDTRMGLAGDRTFSISYPIAHGLSRKSGRMVAIQDGETQKYRGNPRKALTEILLSQVINQDGDCIGDRTGEDAGAGEHQLLLIRIRRGQRHQIRCHLAAAGLPICGDDLYGGMPASRLALHHWKTVFCHPDGDKMVVIGTAIPEGLIPGSLPLEDMFNQIVSA